MIIQIPCLNEAESLPVTLAGLPGQVDGVDTIEVLVIDDGSTDRTAEVAQAHGVDHLVRLNRKHGLAKAFMAGLLVAIERGADIIVSMDADGEHSPKDIGSLVRPIMRGEADMVIGVRPIESMSQYSPVKRLLERVGSQVVRTLSGTDVADAPCGFRAMTREVALRLNVFSDFSHSIETIIQAGLNKLRIANVPIRGNRPMRPSRQVRSNVSYIWHSIVTILSVYIIYRSARICGVLSLAFLLPGVLLGGWYLFLVMNGQGTAQLHLVIACGLLMFGSLLLAVSSMMAHLLSTNRRLLQELRYLVRSQRSGKPPSARAGLEPGESARELLDGGCGRQLPL
jgi:glycosyltransferase involved in cell wall biosynthesis